MNEENDETGGLEMASGVTRNGPNRRQNDDAIITILTSVLESTQKLADTVRSNELTVARMEVTLSNQDETMKEYNNIGMRLIKVEDLVKAMKSNCEQVQGEKKELEREVRSDTKKNIERLKPPWGTLITGMALAIFVIAMNALADWLFR